jgi:mannitol-specific phosphotransferase system IIBC component
MAKSQLILSLIISFIQCSILLAFRMQSPANNALSSSSQLNHAKLLQKFNKLSSSFTSSPSSSLMNQEGKSLLMMEATKRQNGDASVKKKTKKAGSSSVTKAKKVASKAKKSEDDNKDEDQFNDDNKASFPSFKKIPEILAKSSLSRGDMITLIEHETVYHPRDIKLVLETFTHLLR